MNDCVKPPSFSEATKEATMQEEYKGYVSSDYARRLEETNLELRKQIEQIEQIEQHTTPVFDFTATINAALAQAIALATAPLVERIKYLENHSAAADNTFTLAQRIALLEEVVKNVPDEDRIKKIAEAAAEAAIYDHTSDYDHDEYDRLEDKIDEKVSDAFDDYDLDEKIKNALGECTFNLRVA